MLHTKFHGNQSTGSGKKYFEGFLPCMGVTQMPRTNFRFPYSRRSHIKFASDWPSGFGEEDV